MSICLFTKMSQKYTPTTLNMRKNCHQESVNKNNIREGSKCEYSNGVARHKLMQCFSQINKRFNLMAYIGSFKVTISMQKTKKGCISYFFENAYNLQSERLSLFLLLLALLWYICKY